MANQTNSGPPVNSRARGLMDLLNELIKAICDNDGFMIKDLKALRLTKTLLCAFVTDKFGADAFHEVTVVMSRPSLQALVDISRHPLLGKRVSYVDVSPMFTSENGSVACSLEEIRLYMNRACGEKHLRKGDAERMLGIAFKTFTNRNQTISLAITDNESHMVGGKTLLSNTEHKTCVPWMSKWRSTTEITIRAVFDSGCIIDELEIEDKGKGWRANQYASSFDTDKIVAQLESVCSQVTVLTLEHNHRADTESTLESVKRLVQAAKHLEELHLYTLTDMTGLIPQVLENVASVSLRVVSITDFYIDLSELVAFLNNQKTTLVELELSSGCIDTGTCKDLIAWIKDHLIRLEYLEISKLCEHSIYACGDVTSSCMIKQHEDMQACLADILSGKREI